MLDRRTMLGSAFGLALATTADRAIGQTPPRIRFNVASAQGLAMLEVYAAGVAKMKSLPATDPRSWYFSWYTHMGPLAKAQLLQQVFGSGSGPAYQLANAAWGTCQPHSNPANEPYFVFWHRLYVIYLERMIAAITSTPSFTLPYWDYTSPAHAALPVQFRSPADAKWATLFQPNRNVAGNGFANVNQGDPIDKYDPGVLSLEALGQADFLSFNQLLDQGLHGNIHVFVGNGSNMGSVPTAAEDPIFWLHHANIDRIWYAWTNNGGVNPTNFTNSFTFTAADGTPAVVQLNTVAQNATLDYSYDALPPALNAVAVPPTSRAELVRADRVLLSSAPGARLGAARPVVLGSQPRVFPLRPLGGGPNLAAVLRAPSAPKRLRLVLRGVTAAAPPGTLFTVYMNLPADVRPRSAAAMPYRVGTLNFFDAVAMPGMEGMAAMTGRDHIFDITAVAGRLGSLNRLANATVITIVAAGPPLPASMPTIRGSVDVTGG